MSSSAVSVEIGAVGEPFKSLTYQYFDFDGICPISKEQSKLTLKEIYFGQRKLNFSINSNFKQETPISQFCSGEANSDFNQKLKKFIMNNYSYQFIIDDLDVFAPIGLVDNENNPQYYSTFIFHIYYNENNIVNILASAKNPVHLKENSQFVLSYSVEWDSSMQSVSERLDSYLNPQFLNPKIHKYSLLQLIVQASILLLIFYFIYRQIMSDFESSKKSTIFDDFDELQSSDYRGWKILHGDVFRNPNFGSFLSSLVGSGSQLFFISIITLFICYLQPMEKSNLNAFNYFFFFYILCSLISGFISSTFGYSFQERHWLRISVSASYIFPIISYILLFLSNFFGNKPFSLLSIIILGVTLLIPISLLSILGGILGAKTQLFNDPPCNVALIPRHLPKLPWYLSDSFVCVSVGFFLSLTFLTEYICILHSLFLSNVYGLFGHLFITGILIFIISALLMAIITFFRLQSEWYKWHWISFLSPLTSGIFIILYSIAFYSYFDAGNSLFQFISYLFKTSILGFGFGLIVGFGGFIGAEVMVYTAYSNIKVD